MKARYTVLIEKGPKSYGAYVPDLPGCVAVGKTAAEAEKLIREAIRVHLDGMAEDGDPVPESSTRALEVEVNTATPRASRSRSKANDS
jgi:predicted RNase H-like HicB family nuclease